jgi:hypothetical protein
MRTILLMLVIAALPAASALAQQVSPHKPDRRPPADKLLPLKGAARGNCAAYGPGFVKVEGSDSCIRIGGGISVGAGANSGGR